MSAVAPDRHIGALTLVTLALAMLALLVPFSASEYPVSIVGWLLLLAAGIEVLHGRRRSTAASRRQAAIGALITLMIALFLINAPYVTPRALVVLLAGWFGLDVIRNAIAAFRSRPDERGSAVVAAAGNAGVALLLVFARGDLLTWIVCVAAALRIAGIAWRIKTAPRYDTTEATETVLYDPGLDDDPEAAAMAAEIDAAQRARAPADRGWTIGFIATLFAIHIGRMGTDKTFLGIISPGVAVLGDMLIAIIVTMLVLDPLYMMWVKPTRWIERGIWRRYLRTQRSGRASWVDRALATWLRWRLTFAIRLRACRIGTDGVDRPSGPADRRRPCRHCACLGHELH